jgi:hypothetical protein
MAEFENHGKRPRGAPSGAQDENSALAELSRFVDMQGNRGEQGRERRRPSAEVRNEPLNSAERADSHARERYADDDSDPNDAAPARARDFRNKDAWFEPQEDALDRRRVYIDDGAATRRRLLEFTALIIVVGLVGLAASSVSWRKLSNSTGTTLIGRGAKPQPIEMEDADRPARNASIVDAQPADVPSDDRGASSAPVGVPASAASIPSPEATPSTPPAREPAVAKHDDPGYVLAPIEEVATTPKLLFDQAPPLNLDSSSEPSAVSKVERAGDVENAREVENVSGVEKETKSRVDESISNCLVKVAKRVLINRSCQVSWTRRQRVTFALGEKPLTISHEHGRTWLATLGNQELGKVFKTGSCWGSKRVYICEHHK